MNDALADGYYALLDPDSPGTMTYWRAVNGLIGMWPAKAWYGPSKLLKRDAPADRDERLAWGRAWFDHHQAWLRAVRVAIEGAPDVCRARFAAFTIRCCDCGRSLTDAKSKTLGVGPECRRGYDEAWLAALLTPAIAEAHAAALQPAEETR